MGVYLRLHQNPIEIFIQSSIIKDHPNENRNTLQKKNKFIYIGFL